MEGQLFVLIFFFMFYSKNATRNKCLPTSNKCLTSSNKKLLEIRTLQFVNSALRFIELSPG